MARSTRERLMRVGLGLALLAGVVAVTFGAGYRASNALLDGASAYVQKRHTVVRVNAESGDTDAQAARDLAGGNQRLEVVQVAPGVVYVVNNETGAVWRLPTDTLKPDAAGSGDQKAAENPPQVVAGGGRAYLFDKKRGALTLIEEPSGPVRKQIALPGPATEVVVDRSGTAWALSQQVGELYGIAGGPIVARYRVADHPWEPALLTLAGDRPIVYRPERGAATMFDRRGQVRTVELPREKTWRGVDVAAPGADTPVLVITSQASGELIKVDFTSGDTRRTRLADPAGHQFGPSVVSHGRLYVPDYIARRVVVLEAGSLRQVLSERVPGVTRFEMFERDGRVWVNDPYDKDMLSFDRDGRLTTIDKNRGGDVAEPERSETQRPESSPPPAEHAPPQIPPSSLRPHRPHESASPPPRVPPSPPSGPKLIAVPDLGGLSSDEACQKLKSISLGCAGNSVPDGTHTGVYNQSPGPQTQVSSGTVVSYLYQPIAPVPLNRYKAEKVHSRFLSRGGGPTGDGVWNQQPPTAAVYPPEAIGQVPGLVAVYQSGCGNCDVQRLYYYANADGRNPAQPTGNWASKDGAEFACFFRSSAPQGTVPLMRMWKGSGQQRRWEFATSSSEQAAHQANGYADDKDLCYVWPR
jgi:hypothetical protein